MICPVCSREFAQVQKEIERGNGKVCSLRCASVRAAAARRKKAEARRVEVACANCGASLRRAPSRVGRYNFCDRACKEKAQKVGGISGIQPPHYGTGRSRYRKKALERGEIVCARCGYSKVPGILEVHHIDRNRENANIENLIILCPNCHAEDHFSRKDGRWRKFGA